MTASRIATLGDTLGPGMLASAPRSVLRDLRGRYWVTVYRDKETPQVFNVNGVFSHRLGRAGHGPQEYGGGITLWRAPSDSIYLFDEQNARITVLSPQGQFNRSMTGPIGAESVAITESGSIVFNADIPSATKAGWPLHMIRPDGAVQPSFGVDVPVFRNDVPRMMSRLLANAGNDEIWSVQPTRYVIERIDTRSQKRTQLLERRATWFAPHWLPAIVAPTPDRPPTPYVVGVRQDPHRRLWIYTLVADAKWKSVVTEREQRGAPGYSVSDIDKYYDTMVEVIDPSTHTLIATGRFERALPMVVEFNLLAALNNDRSGTSLRVDVWQVVLSSPHK